MSGVDANGFRVGAAERLACWLVEQAEREPFQRGEAILLDAEASPARMRHADLVEALRSAGMSALARRVNRTIAPTGYAVAVVLGASVGVEVVRVDDLGGVAFGGDARTARAALLGSLVHGRTT